MSEYFIIFVVYKSKITHTCSILLCSEKSFHFGLKQGAGIYLYPGSESVIVVAHTQIQLLDGFWSRLIAIYVPSGWDLPHQAPNCTNF